jgi:hypothetical protein
MFELMIMASIVIATRPAPDPDCRPQMILTSNGSTVRDPAPQTQRQRPKPQQRTRTAKPCLILASV